MRPRLLRNLAVGFAMLLCLAAAVQFWQWTRFASAYRGSPVTLPDGRTIAVISKGGIEHTYWELTYRASRRFTNERDAEEEVLRIWNLLIDEPEKLQAGCVSIEVIDQQSEFLWDGWRPVLVLSGRTYMFEKTTDGAWIQEPKEPLHGMHMCLLVPSVQGVSALLVRAIDGDPKSAH